MEAMGPQVVPMVRLGGLGLLAGQVVLREGQVVLSGGLAVFEDGVVLEEVAVLQGRAGRADPVALQGDPEVPVGLQGDPEVLVGLQGDPEVPVALLAVLLGVRVVLGPGRAVPKAVRAGWEVRRVIPQEMGDRTDLLAANRDYKRNLAGRTVDNLNHQEEVEPLVVVRTTACCGLIVLTQGSIPNSAGRIES
jgi:hypothetical protein